ncbi:hypothetical protein HGB24_03325 [Candidatus Saccharibacteria bacterium]|nr:hypothetical protein [Candidatus Saccharibacteria bacterium]
MDLQPQTTKPISDDQELAKALAGVTDNTVNDLNFEETPLQMPESHETPETSEQASELPEPNAPSSMPEPVPVHTSPSPIVDTIKQIANGDLGGIKKEAIDELRPLVDKLELSAEEKFDIYLLIIRSTDDTSLIAPAHAAAREIADEARRAQALLDIIKEIDYLSASHQAE